MLLVVMTMVHEGGCWALGKDFRIAFDRNYGAQGGAGILSSWERSPCSFQNTIMTRERKVLISQD